MFHFGPFFTQLPLLIIGSLYVLYLGLSVVNKEKTGLNEEKIRQNDVQITETCGANANSVDYFTLATASDSFADNPKPHFIDAPCCLAENIIPPCKEDFPVIYFYGISILSRPPPES